MRNSSRVTGADAGASPWTGAPMLVSRWRLGTVSVEPSPPKTGFGLRADTVAERGAFIRNRSSVTGDP